MYIRLSDPSLEPLIEEARQAHDAVARIRGQRGPLDLRTQEGLHDARLLESYGTPLGSATELGVEDLLISYGHRNVTARVLRPDTSVSAVYLDIHGGGFYCGSPSMDDDRNLAYTKGLGAVIVSIDYRLAPEHPWPAAVEDCEGAIRWLLENSVDAFGTSTVFIGGASAGANLAVAALLRLKDRPPTAGHIAGANLLYGAYDLSGLSPSGRAHYAAGAEIAQAYIGHLHISEWSQPTISPLYGDLTGLPPAMFTVGDMDERFYEENTAMAMRWAAAGNLTHLNVYPGSGHGFDHLSTKMAEAATGRIVEWMRHLS